MTRHQELFQALEGLLQGSTKAHDLEMLFDWHPRVCEAMARAFEIVTEEAEKEGGAW